MMRRVPTAMIVFSYYPSDVRVRREAEALAAAGYSVDIICLRREGQAKNERVNGVSTYRIKLKRRRGGKLRYLFEYTYFIIFSFFWMACLQFKKRYRLVHVHNLPDFLVFSALIPKLIGAKIVLDLHELMPEFFMRKYNMGENNKTAAALKTVEKFSAKFADHVIVATPFLRETIIRRFCPPAKCTTILNISDPKYFQKMAGRSGKCNNRFRMIYPGNVNEFHGVDVVIHAVKLIRSETEIPIEFHIYGHGSAEELNHLKQLSNDLQLTDVVLFHPSVPLEQLVPVFNEMDVGVVPKRDGLFSGEAISTKLFDFAAVGLPCIVTRTRGDSLYFDDSMVLFFESENGRQLADSIKRLYNDPDLRKTLSDKAHAVFTKISWATMREELFSIYRALLLDRSETKA